MMYVIHRSHMLKAVFMSREVRVYFIFNEQRLKGSSDRARVVILRSASTRVHWMMAHNNFPFDILCRISKRFFDPPFLRQGILVMYMVTIALVISRNQRSSINEDNQQLLC